jgi:hypothetical protein
MTGDRALGLVHVAAAIRRAGGRLVLEIPGYSRS